MYNAVLSKANSDSTFKAKVDASALRVLTAKQKRGLLAQGLDVSAAQGSVDWQAAYNNGARFAYVKATEGTSYTNPSFSQQYNGSYNIGMIRGAYHFAHPDSSSGAAQADYFVAHGGGWSADGRTLPPALSLQNNPSGAQCYGLSPAAMVSWIKAFSNEMQAKTDKYPMITTSFAWWNACTGNSNAFAATNPFWMDSFTRGRRPRYRPERRPGPCGRAARRASSRAVRISSTGRGPGWWRWPPITTDERARRVRPARTAPIPLTPARKCAHPRAAAHSSAPGMLAANQRLCPTGTISSCSPCTNRTGALMSDG